MEDVTPRLTQTTILFALPAGSRLFFVALMSPVDSTDHATKIYKELKAEFWGASAKLMELQLLQLELRLGKTPSRSFRPVKSPISLWQFWASSSFGVSLAHDGS
ncbi:hypothetical protein Tco_1057035 [Tanacetum coccineum]|uniref:Uncharacterized protein n=1 Tax=Tanacetum coccineum TaxID=301880 RepID=A0ABQ5H4B6_9ASTR